jgi:hypothetical protein
VEVTLMDGLTPDRVSGRRGWRAAGRKSPSHARSKAPMPLPEPLEHGKPAGGFPRRLHEPLRQRAGASCACVDAGTVAAFARLACAGGPDAPFAEVARLRTAGADVPTILLELLVPAARHLAHCWQSDQCRYEELAVGMLHLQQLLHDLSADFASEGQAGPCGRRVVLLSAPAEQTMLGLFMVTEFHRCVGAEFFHHAGWDVWRAPPTSRAQLLALLRGQWFDVVEVTASCGDRLALLAADLAEIRRASRNSRLHVVVGGPALEGRSDAAAMVGADAVATGPQDMLRAAESLVARHVHPRPRPSR